jgi:tubulin delta
VDMEPKVVAHTLANARALRSWWSYSRACTLAEQSGSGNNWGRGYAHYGPAHREAACELVRHEVRADNSFV